jgi:coproporphyrinogen III oxidase
VTFMQLNCVRQNYGSFLTKYITWQMQKQACDKHDPKFYPKYKKWCDEYFLIKVSAQHCFT